MLEICTKYNKVSNTILFFIKNNSEFKSHNYFIIRNLRKAPIGVNSCIGCYLDFKYSLNLKQLKIEISK